MADWYVYQHDGDPLGPWSTDGVANAILAGKLAPDVWVAAPGGPRWLRALDVPVIACLVEGIPTRPRRDSGLRLIPGAFATEDGVLQFGSTMMMVKDDELELAGDQAIPHSSHAGASATSPAAKSVALAPESVPVSSNTPTSQRAPATIRSHAPIAPASEETVMVKVEVRPLDTEDAPVNTPRGPFPSFAAEAPSTVPAIAPESTTPSLPPAGRSFQFDAPDRDAAIEAPSSDRRRRRKNA